MNILYCSTLDTFMEETALHSINLEILIESALIYTPDENFQNQQSIQY